VPGVDVPLVPAAPVMGVVETGPLSVACETQVQSIGQSVFEAQVVAFGWHEPGKVVVVVHVWSGGTAGAGTATSAAGAVAPVLGGAEPPPMAGPVLPGVAVPVPAEPEQEPMTVGVHMKPAPQSVSVLQGSCQVNMQREIFVSVGVQGGGTTLVAVQSVLGAHGATAAPPLAHVEDTVSVWHTMLGPHSESAAHGAASQYPLAGATSALVLAGVAGPVGAGAGAGVAMFATQTKPWWQSAVVMHVWACARDAVVSARARAPNEKISLLNDMWSPWCG